MSNDNKRQQLIDKLKEMFQMDQADLDFGIYRIMNAKRDEITRFLEQDLLPTLRTTLEEFQPAGLADKKKELAEAIENARKLKIDPDSLDVVQQLKAELAEGGDIDRLESQVYSDLYTFFSRYYQDGDFLSLRRYKEGVYALPYEGEEVKLHWANADQYYIKTAENFTRYAFKSGKGRVRFELAAASTERDNNKATDDNERRFILAETPLVVEDGELVIRFEYRPDAEKRKQKELNAAAVESLLALPEGAPLATGINNWPEWRAVLAIAAPTEKNKTRSLLEKHLTDYTARNTFDYFIHKDLSRFLRRELDFFIKNEVMHLDDIESDSASKVESYLARIKAMRRIAHKLIAFLAQLENFQKKLWLKKKFVLETNWLVTLARIPEDLYPEICKQVERPVRRWNGKMQSQREAWVELFAIDKPLQPPAKLHTSVQDDMLNSPSVPYSVPLTPEFLNANLSLVLNTDFFDQTFKDLLLQRIDNLNAVTDGLLVHGDNFQGLDLLQEGYSGQVKCIYIDPPYNTGNDGFAYKDNYKSSSWVSMIADRLRLSRKTLKDDGVIFASINEIERLSLEWQLRETYGAQNAVAEVIWARDTVSNNSPTYSKNHEYIEVFAKNLQRVEQDKSMFRETKPGYIEVSELITSLQSDYPPITTVTAELRRLYEDHKRDFVLQAFEQGQSKEEATKNDPWKGLYPYKFAEYRNHHGQWVPEEDAEKSEAVIWVFREVEPSMPSGKQSSSISEPDSDNYRFYKPTNPHTAAACQHPKRGWAFPLRSFGNRPSFDSYENDKRIVFKGAAIPQLKYFLHEVDTAVSTTVIRQYADGEPRLEELFGKKGLIDNPKPPDLIARLIKQTVGSGQLVLDFFAGSGTTAQSVIEQNRRDGLKRSVLLIEIGTHFDSVLLPRLQKIIFSPAWESGMPKRLPTSDELKDGFNLIKIIRLESYEDVCDNLSLTRASDQQKLIEQTPSLREGYFLKYMLDVESRPSLLNLDKFIDPFDVQMSLTRNDETRSVKVDMVETFNYLLGLRVQSMRRLKGVYEVIGTTPQGDRTLILWRHVHETDSDALDDWFRKQAYSSRDREFDLIYVNGDNNLENLRRSDESWKVRLIEEAFHTLMFDVEDV